MLSLATINQTMAERMAPIRNQTDPGSLLIHEIYRSIQGESSHMGRPCVFIRTTGCHLRCSYCDTEPAFFRGQILSIDMIIERVAEYGIKVVELTGGEPLLQAGSFNLLDRLVDLKYTVLLETSGAVSIAKVNRRVKVILDIKMPSSGEQAKNVSSNLDILWHGCEVKFVIASIEDYQYAKNFCYQHNLFDRIEVLFSPVVAQIDAKELVDLILNDHLPVRFQLQLHRVLYGEQAGK